MANFDNTDRDEFENVNQSYGNDINAYQTTNADNVKSEVDDNASDLEPEDEDEDEDFGTDGGGGEDVEGGGDDASGGADSV